MIFTPYSTEVHKFMPLRRCGVALNDKEFNQNKVKESADYEY